MPLIPGFRILHVGKGMRQPPHGWSTSDSLATAQRVLTSDFTAGTSSWGPEEYMRAYLTPETNLNGLAKTERWFIVFDPHGTLMEPERNEWGEVCP